MKTKDLKRKQKAQPGGSLKPVGSARWRVRFMCKGGGYHPVWYGEHEGPTIQRDAVEMAAKAYLRSQKYWLKRIDMIEADEKPNERGQARREQPKT